MSVEHDEPYSEVLKSAHLATPFSRLRVCWHCKRTPSLAIGCDYCGTLYNADPAIARPPVREAAYVAIDDERTYQAGRWARTPSGGVDHSVTEFLVYMRSYVNEALELVSRKADPAASREALHAVRKVAALGVACMERHGAPHRVRQ